MLLLFSLRQYSKGKGRLDVLPVPFSFLILIISFFLIFIFTMVRAGMLRDRRWWWHWWRPGVPETFRLIEREARCVYYCSVPQPVVYNNLRLSTLQRKPIVGCKLDLLCIPKFNSLEPRTPQSFSTTKYMLVWQWSLACAIKKYAALPALLFATYGYLYWALRPSTKHEILLYSVVRICLLKFRIQSEVLKHFSSYNANICKSRTKQGVLVWAFFLLLI